MNKKEILSYALAHIDQGLKKEDIEKMCYAMPECIETVSGYRAIISSKENHGKTPFMKVNEHGYISFSKNLAGILNYLKSFSKNQIDDHEKIYLYQAEVTGFSFEAYARLYVTDDFFARAVSKEKEVVVLDDELIANVRLIKIIDPNNIYDELVEIEKNL